MIHIKFKNLEKSDAAIEIATERISEAIERFPKGQPRIVVVTLSMENSPQKAGVDVFSVRTEIIGGRYHGLILEKSSPDLYVALAHLCHALLERFNRYSDRLRVKSLKQRRSFVAEQRGYRRHRAQGEGR